MRSFPITPKNLKRITAAVFCLVLTLAAVLVASWFYPFGFHDADDTETMTTYAMGSIVQQTVYGAQAEAAESAASSAITALENRISWRVEGSEINELNQAAGKTDVTLSQETVDLLEQLLDISKESGGAFDITIAPLGLLWNFDTDPTLPSDEDIRYFKQFVGYENLILDTGTNKAHLSNEKNAVDLGAAGKGAACDVAYDAYKEAGVEAGIIAVGGSVGLYGTKPDDSLWNIAVRDPDNVGTLGTLSLESGFISTSGSYEKCFEENGVLYHHLLDPQTGYPADSGLVSVTVVSDSGASSDALSTACFVLGYEKSLPLLEHYNAQAVFIDTNHQIYVTEGLRDAFTLTSSAYTIVS